MEDTKYRARPKGAGPQTASTSSSSSSNSGGNSRRERERESVGEPKSSWTSLKANFGNLWSHFRLLVSPRKRHRTTPSKDENTSRGYHNVYPIWGVGGGPLFLTGESGRRIMYRSYIAPGRSFWLPSHRCEDTLNTNEHSEDGPVAVVFGRKQKSFDATRSVRPSRNGNCSKSRNASRILPSFFCSCT